MLVNDNSGDPQVHCEARGAVGLLYRGYARKVKARTGRSWSAVPGCARNVRARHRQLVCGTHFKSFTPPAREYLTQYSAVRWETAPWVRAKARDPLGGRTQGMDSARSTGLSLP